MNRQILCIFICFIVGILIFMLMRSYCGCDNSKVVEGKTAIDTGNKINEMTLNQLIPLMEDKIRDDINIDHIKALINDLEKIGHKNIDNLKSIIEEHNNGEPISLDTTLSEISNYTPTKEELQKYTGLIIKHLFKK